MKKVRLLIAVDSFFDGGAEMFAIRLANGLAGVADVHFVAVRPWLTPNSKQRSLLDRQRLTAIELTGSRWGDFIFKSLQRVARRGRLAWLEKWVMDWRLRFICRKHRIDVVNSHSWASDGAFARIKDSSRFKFVSSFHGHYELPETSGPQEIQSQKQLRAVDAVVYVSPKHLLTLDKFGVPLSKRTRIFYGIPVAPETKTTAYHPGSPLKLLMASRGIREKGWSETVQAVASINREHGRAVTIDLLGDGNLLNELREQYKGHDGIRFHGYCDDILPFVKESHIGLLPSYYPAESLPNVVIEYLICGKPVVVTDVGAVPEMVSCNGKAAGIVLNLKNGGPVSSEEIRAALMEFIRNPERVEHDSALALCAAEKFRMQTCTENYLNVYKTLSA